MMWLSTLRSRVRGFRSLSWPERRAFLWAAAVLPVVKLGLRFWPLKRVQAWLAPRGQKASAASDEAALAQARRLALVVTLAARHGVGNHNCLPRSVVLWALLRRRGLDGQLRIGVGLDDTDSRSFHAWVEHCGHVLNDTPDVAQRYMPFPGEFDPRLA
jgi:hypothetical protein